MTDKELMDLVRTVALSQDTVRYQTAWQTLKAHCTLSTDAQQTQIEAAIRVMDSCGKNHDHAEAWKVLRPILAS